MTHVLAVVFALVLVWYTYFTHPEARLVVVLGVLLGVAILLIPAVWLGLLQDREKRRIVEWTSELAEARQLREAESDEEAA